MVKDCGQFSDWIADMHLCVGVLLLAKKRSRKSSKSRKVPNVLGDIVKLAWLIERFNSGRGQEYYNTRHMCVQIVMSIACTGTALVATYLQAKQSHFGLP